MRLATVLPHLASPQLRQLIVMPDQVLMVLASAHRTARCPLCRRRSARVHSRYERMLTDLLIAERPVRLQLQVRRFRPSAITSSPSAHDRRRRAMRAHA